MKIRTSKTEKKIKEELYKKDKRIREKALLEGRRGYTRREFLKIMAGTLGMGLAMVNAPSLFAKVVNDPSSIVPDREKYLIGIKVKENSRIDYKIAYSLKRLGTIIPKEASRMQMENLKEELIAAKEIHNLDVNFKTIIHPAKPISNMKKGREALTRYFVLSVETSNAQKLLERLSSEEWIELVTLMPKIKPILNAVPYDYYASGAPGTPSRGVPPLYRNVVTGIYDADDILRASIERRGIRSEPIKVGILDVEFYPHEDLNENLWINEDEIPGDKIDNDGDGYIDNYKCWTLDAEVPGAMNIRDWDENAAFINNNHGTTVAGVGTARWSNIVGVTGSSANLTRMVYTNMNTYSGKIDESYYEGLNKDILVLPNLIYLADMGCKVINMSFQISEKAIVDGETLSTEQLGQIEYMHDFLGNFIDDGITIVASAGNEAPDGDGSDRLVIPAKLPDVIAVASSIAKNYDIDKGKVPAEFSSKGRQYKEVNGKLVEGGRRALFVPGEDWTTSYREEGNNNAYNWGLKQQTYQVLAGTSLSAPLVSGFIGAILYVWPEMGKDRYAIKTLQDMVMGSGIWRMSAERLDGKLRLVDNEDYSYIRKLCRVYSDGTMVLELPDTHLFRADLLAKTIEDYLEHPIIIRPVPTIPEQNSIPLEKM